MEELRSNPPAQELLMHALLTREFLGMPLRLERIESQLDAMLGRLDSLEEGQRRLEGRMDSLEEGQHKLEGRMDSLEEGQSSLQRSVHSLQNTVGALVGDSLEMKLPGRIVPLISQKIRLRRAEIMRSSILGINLELSEAIADAVDNGVIEEWQQDRISLTDVIIRAQRQSDRSWVWLAVEASSAIHRHDIERARQSADSLTAALHHDAVAIVVGYEIDPDVSRQAADIGVEALIIS